MSSKSGKTIKRLFIANRGEIARRIAWTAKRLGIESIALYETEIPSYLVGIVTHFVKVPEENTKLYLDPAAMIRLAKENGADSVHPGFGFLSENAGFAKAVIDAGLTWIGPNPKSIDAMASKARARELATAAKVPCVPGLEDVKISSASDTKGIEALTTFAKKSGYPLLIKAALGGGGKGMRIVEKDSELVEAAQRAASEAQSSFGDASLIVEKYLTDPRHVEVQILADKHGHVYAIGDRDCSVQRRHQKVIEEAPAPMLDAKTRTAMHAAATSLAAKVGYDSTGTVEFLVDWSDAARKSGTQPFYFLEMNTRLQVEHPVTEEVFGLDLVEWQLRVAQGEALPDSFKTIEPRGHAIEVRFYAEDCRADYFPAPGIVYGFLPAQGPGVRWDVGIDSVDEVTAKFDPMIAKAIVRADTREKACSLLAQVLEDTLFAGPASNRDFVAWILRHTEFNQGAVSTKFLKTYLAKILGGLDSDRSAHEQTATAILKALQSGGQTSGDGDHSSSFTVAARAFHPAVAKQTSSGNETDLRLTSSSSQSRGTMQTQFGRGTWGEKRTPFAFAKANTPAGQTRFVLLGGQLFTAEDRRSSLGEHQAADTSDKSLISAPVPGKVQQIKIKEGDVVSKGQSLVILESMKMEFDVKAARDGTIASVLAKVGAQVSAGEKLATLTQVPPNDSAGAATRKSP